MKLTDEPAMKKVLQPLPPPYFALPIIADLLLTDDVVDYISFRAVCREWRSCTVPPRGLDSRFGPRCWIMLPDGDANLYTGTNRLFLNRSTGRFLLLCLPELDSHYVFSDSDGLLFLVDKLTHLIRLFNPFTRHLVDLLPLPAELLRHGIVDIIECFSFSISTGSCPTVVLFISHYVLAYFAKPGDSSWGSFTFQVSPGNVLFFKDRFYFADYVKGIQYVDLDNKSFTTLIPPPSQHRRLHVQCYLAEYNTELLIIYREPIGTDGIPSVFLIDLFSNGLVSFRETRDLSIFVGLSKRSLVLSAKNLPSIKANLVYFCTGTYKYPIIAYDFDDGKPEYISVDSALHDYYKRRSPSIRPFSLTHHLSTYCNQLYWSIGLMYHEFLGLTDEWWTPGCQMDDLIQKYIVF